MMLLNYVMAVLSTAGTLILVTILTNELAPNLLIAPIIAVLLIMYVLNTSHLMHQEETPW